MHQPVHMLPMFYTPVTRVIRHFARVCVSMQSHKTVCILTQKPICRYVTVALAIAHYYWTRGNREVMPRFPVLHAIRTTLRCAVLCHTVPQTCSKAFSTPSLPGSAACVERQSIFGSLHQYTSLNNMHAHYLTSQCLMQCYVTPVSACVM